MAPRFTYEQRLQICKYKEANILLSHAEVAAWTKGKFGLTTAPSQVIISKILKKKHDYELMDEYELHAKRPRRVNFPDLEEALSLWVLQCQHRNVFITYDLIKAQGQRFAKILKILEDIIKFSNGWLYKFLFRNKLKSFKIHGEAGSVDDDAIEAAMPALRARIAAFNPEDVYNMDETGLFYSMVPDTTIVQQRLFEAVEDDRRAFLGEEQVEEELTDALHRLPLRDPMSIASLLNPIEESGVEHMFLNDEEIANLVTGQENNPSIGDPEEEEPAQLTRAEKLKGLSVVISMLNPADPVEHQVH
ncbi:hypothetical protein Mp_1g06570 [Marchantia polymorpha subsp. ruderalis]|uniref:HTH CENPB-type domain-containing protein n=1 Tax=Marchantia polymorpha subsp. ruderalis TaxID=1480154 RepID=A0AAF6AM89_MARPO|nr:hypothetical protein Mp_1g06570 [Marchantia polymorpha subsp. ruderalis]